MLQLLLVADRRPCCLVLNAAAAAAARCWRACNRHAQSTAAETGELLNPPPWVGPAGLTWPPTIKTNAYDLGFTFNMRWAVHAVLCCAVLCCSMLCHAVMVMLWCFMVGGGSMRRSA